MHIRRFPLLKTQRIIVLIILAIIVLCVCLVVAQLIWKEKDVVTYLRKRNIVSANSVYVTSTELTSNDSIFFFKENNRIKSYIYHNNVFGGRIIPNGEIEVDFQSSNYAYQQLSISQGILSDKKKYIWGVIPSSCDLPLFQGYDYIMTAECEECKMFVLFMNEGYVMVK